MVRSKKELDHSTVDELILMAQEAIDKQATHGEKFKAAFPDTEITYEMITNRIRKAGYVSKGRGKWEKETTEEQADHSKSRGDNVSRIVMLSGLKNVRYNLTMTEPVKQRYEDFLKDKAKAYQHTSAALQIYMDLYEKAPFLILETEYPVNKVNGELVEMMRKHLNLEGTELVEMMMRKHLNLEEKDDAD